VQSPNESILSKYLYIVMITFFVTVLIYHLLVRPYALTRFLFGMKPKEKPKPVMEIERDEAKPVVALSA
jgi:preprotein translocase subunit SecG